MRPSSNAGRMGVPTARLVIGSNRNDVLPRWLATGRLELNDVHPTISPSMDIQVSSNTERLLFELYGRNATLLADRMTDFRAEGRVETGDTRLAAVTEVFDGASFSDDDTRAEIRRTYDETGVILDPHTAVGYAAARQAAAASPAPMVTLATAHPAKFPDAVERATGQRPQLPARVGDLFDREERYAELPVNYDAIAAYVAEHATPSS